MGKMLVYHGSYVEIRQPEIRQRVITRKQFWGLARFKYPTHQINFCTERALQCLRFEYSEEVIK